MDIKHLTTDEILRMHSPETSLEKVLFERIETAIEEAESAKNDAAEIIREAEDFQCSECPVLEDKIDEREDTIKSLRALLDDHEIDHSEI